MKETTKTKEAQTWVDEYIKINGVPPTYDEIAEGLEISKTAAYARCRTFREKMSVDLITRMRLKNSTHIKLDMLIPNDRINEFTYWLEKVSEFILDPPKD